MVTAILASDPVAARAEMERLCDRTAGLAAGAAGMIGSGRRWWLGAVARGGAVGTRLLGRVAVITGGCAGIGLATARRFTDEGAKLVIGDVNAEAGAALAAELDATFVAVDVTDPEQVEALFQTAFDTYGSVDIAFNNAEILPLEDGSILATGLDDWRRVQEANLTSVYLCCKSALRFMLEQKRGSIINTASYLAVLGSAESRIAYTAAKGGVLALSRELGVQFARDGIRVNALCPGPVTTPVSQELSRLRPGRLRAPAGAHPDGPVRRAAGDRLGGGLPGLGRVQLHHRRRSSWWTAASPAPTSPRCKSD